jgi:acetolactate decarboxylase
MRDAMKASLKPALEERSGGSSSCISSVVTAGLARYLKKPIHTLFQVSTSGALVAGVYDGKVSAKTLLEHREFGLGTFADMGGETGRRRWPRVPGRRLWPCVLGPAGRRRALAVATWFEASIDVSIMAGTAFIVGRGIDQPPEGEWQRSRW